MTTEFLSVSRCFSALACSKRLMAFIICLFVLVRTGTTKGFQDVAVVFGPSRRDLGKTECPLRLVNGRASKTSAPRI